MGRRSGGGGGYRPPRRAPTPAPRPASKPSSAVPATTNNGAVSAVGSVASNITEGLSWGFGTSIGHRVSEFFFGPRTIRVEETTAAASSAPSAAAAAAAAASLDASSCGIHHKAFADCIWKNGSDISRCQFYIDLLNECRRGNTGGATMA